MILNWGATAQEAQHHPAVRRPDPGRRTLRRPGGQHRRARVDRVRQALPATGRPCSYDLIDNFGRRSPRTRDRN